MMDDAMEVEEQEGLSPHEHGDFSAEHARPRKRTRRACDKCSSSRTRCDGECPCRRCEDYGYKCHYNREIKKRGRVPTSLATSGTSESSTSKSTPQQFFGSSRDGPSPASSVTSPDVALPAGSYPLPPLSSMRRESMSRPVPSSHSSFSSPSAPLVSSASSITAQILPCMPPSSTASYIASPSNYGAPHVHLQLSSLLDPSAENVTLPRSNESPPGMQPAVSGSDSSTGYPSPANGILNHGPAHPAQSRIGSFSQANHKRDRESFSTSGTDGAMADFQRTNSLHQVSSSDCRYRCLDPVLPYLRDIIPASVACDLLDVYLTEPGSSLFKCASPYILTRIFRKKSLLHSTSPRPITPALLATMLWCAAQTADIVLLHVPGSRSKITNALYDLATSLISERDPDRWRRIHGGLCAEAEQPQQFPFSSALPPTTATNEPAGVVDDVLTFILLSIAVSGGDFKTDCYKWWNKAIRLALSLKLNREDEQCVGSISGPCANPLYSCRRDREMESVASLEAQEERRRVFWLLYCLDRHLSLSFNTVFFIPDSYCEVYSPLTEALWENLDSIPLKDLPPRILGPPTVITGTGFFEYFLPLMAILGDIIEVHHRRQHPRLGHLDDSAEVAVIIDLLNKCELSIQQLRDSEIDVKIEVSNDYAMPITPHSAGPSIKDLMNNPMSNTSPTPPAATASMANPLATATSATTNGTAAAGGTGHVVAAHQGTSPRAKDRSRLQLVTAYSTHILHVLHVLLHGKWDAICMLDNDADGGGGGDDWITTRRFHDCASHAIGASEAVSDILKSDPELTFMPYLFGIYLLHGSFILLLFADRMPQLGPNQSVEQACETIIRAHEVCVVTLSTEFQKNFRKVLRSTLYSVQGSSPTEWEEHKARRRALSLYRWTKGAKGLGL